MTSLLISIFFFFFQPLHSLIPLVSFFPLLHKIIFLDVLKPISHPHNKTSKVFVFVLGGFSSLFILLFSIYLHSISHGQSRFAHSPLDLLMSTQTAPHMVHQEQGRNSWLLILLRQSSSWWGHNSTCSLAVPVTGFMAHFLGSQMRYQVFPPDLLLLFLITFIKLKGCIQSHKYKWFYFLWLIGPEDSKALYTSCGFTPFSSSNIS